MPNAVSVVRIVGGVWQPIKHYAIAHKVMTGIALIVIFGGAYWTYGAMTSTSGETRYVLGTVQTGTIISTVSGSGQVAASDSVDIKPQVSGTITWIGVEPGDLVKAGAAIASIDDTTAAQALADAKKSLAADQLQYQKDTAQAPIDYQNDQTALDNANTSLKDDYNDVFNDLTATYLDLPDVVSYANEVLYGYDFDTKKSQWNMDVLINLFNSANADPATARNFQANATAEYSTARSEYDAAVSAYKGITRSSDTKTLDSMLGQSITMTTDIAQALQTELNFLGSVSDLAQTYGVHLPTAFTSVQSTARTNLSTANANLTTLLADKKTLDNAKQAIISAQQKITLDQVGNPNGSNPISLQISKNSLEKSAQDIQSQETDLAKYTIRAPFSGTISAVSAKIGDTAGSAAVASIISPSQIATLSLNEIDAAKVKLNDKATLTFDAIDGLSLTGTVAEIDSVGTVSQGVVSYTVKINFDTQDARIKPGMTVNASIQTDVHQNVLVVPASAVKTQGGQSYVQVFNPPLTSSGGTTGVVSVTPPTNMMVEVGISDDTNTEITSGLKEGDQIVTRTITGNTAASATGSATTRTTTGTAAGGRNTGFGGGGGFGGGIRL